MADSLEALLVDLECEVRAFESIVAQQRQLLGLYMHPADTQRADRLVQHVRDHIHGGLYLIRKIYYAFFQHTLPEYPLPSQLKQAATDLDHEWALMSSAFFRPSCPYQAPACTDPGGAPRNALEAQTRARVVALTRRFASAWLRHTVFIGSYTLQQAYAFDPASFPHGFRGTLAEYDGL